LSQLSFSECNALSRKQTEKTRVTDALEYVRHQYPDLALDEGMFLITVNLKMASLETVLEANDIVSFLPFMGGG